MGELSREQIERQDFVDNSIHSLFKQLAPSGVAVPWNIEMIAEIREVTRHWLVDRLGAANEMEFYPYIDD